MTKSIVTDVNVINPNDQKFWESFMVALPDISPDAMVHVDWLFLMRSLKGVDTAAGVYKFPNSKDSVLTKDMLANLPEVLDYTSVRTYTSPGLVRRYHLKDGVMVLCVILTRNVEYCSFSIIGEGELVDQAMTKVKEVYTIPNKVTITKMTGFGEDGPILKSDDIAENDPSVVLATNEFYPFLTEEDSDFDIDKIAKEFKESTANVMLLIGPPGTGKTTFLRSLIFKMNMENNIVVMGDTTILHPAFTSYLHQIPQNNLVSIEDADELCRPRDGGGNSQMASLLNFTDGVVNNGTKLVIATNLTSISKVDEALIRDGRAFKVYEFKALTANQANVARQSVDLDPIDFGTVERINLATALNAKEGVKSNAKRQSVGFIGG